MSKLIGGHANLAVMKSIIFHNNFRCYAISTMPRGIVVLQGINVMEPKIITFYPTGYYVSVIHN